MLRRSFLVLSLLLAPACAGDDTEARGGGGGGSNDTGELRGAVATPGNTPAAIEIAVLWEAQGADGEPLTIGSRLQVTAPTHFTIDLTDPPPAAALGLEIWNPDEPDQYGPADPRIAQGYIAALTPGALDQPDALTALADFQDDSVRGWVDGAMLIYLEADVEAGTYMEQYVCGTLSAGYHLMLGELAPGGDFADCPPYPDGSEGSGALMAVAPDDLATELSIQATCDGC
jgi:hypothetical protein